MTLTSGASEADRQDAEDVDGEPAFQIVNQYLTGRVHSDAGCVVIVRELARAATGRRDTPSQRGAKEHHDRQ